MFRLVHISDIHLGPLPDVTYRDLFSKRVTGYLNWQRNRRRLLHPGVIDALLDDIRAKGADHVAITGDLMNLALDAEIELSREWLELLGDPRDVSVVPGNHDAYVPGALSKACRAWKPWITGEKTRVAHNEHGFPYIRLRDPVALIGVSSARATAPFMALGHFGATQAKRMGRLLDHAAGRGLYRVVMIHHPPIRNATTAHKRLYGIGLFQKTILRHGAELVLHGHTHLPTLYWIDGPEGRVPVVGVTAAGQGMGGHKPPAQYNLFEIGGEPGAWSATLTRRGLAGAALALRDIERLALSPSGHIAAI